MKSILSFWHFYDDEKYRLVVTPFFVFEWANPGHVQVQDMLWIGWRFSFIFTKFFYDEGEESCFLLHYRKIIKEIRLIDYFYQVQHE